MRTASLVLASLAISTSVFSVACSGDDGEDIGQAYEELQTVGDESAWDDDSDKKSSEGEFNGKVDSLSVQGNDVRAHGKRFVSRGVIFEGFLYTRRDVEKCVAENYNGDNDDDGRKFCKRHLLARDYYEGKGTFAGKDALTLAMTNWNANTVRFNLNQSVACKTRVSGRGPAT